MKIAFVSVEVAPWAKVGGLADVAGSLPKSLESQGHEVRVILPAYAMAMDGAKLIAGPIKIAVNPHWTVEARLYEKPLGNTTAWLIEIDHEFSRVHKSEELYAFGRDTYIAFAKAILALCEHTGWIPEIVHANDWHTGFLPVLLREAAPSAIWRGTASVFTIHNLKYQGIFGPDTLAVAGLPSSLFVSDKLETFGAVNFIKSACVYSDRVNTVSPTYAEEITSPEYGEGLWGLMGPLRKEGRLLGILNGIDYEFFNPETDAFIAGHFSANDLKAKASCKADLQADCGFKVSAEVPLLGIVSRLSDQKGFDLIIKQSYGMLALGCQFVALGTGDPWAARELSELANEWPNQVHFAERYDAAFAQKIYAGSDLFLMPSAFEPCGLGQMIACRYGTLPIVRQTGGLKDSIFDLQNGFVFEQRSAKELFTTIERAVRLYRNNPVEWNDLVIRAMRSEFGWNGQAKLYTSMYEAALSERKVPATR